MMHSGLQNNYWRNSQFINFYFHEIQFFKISTHFPTTPSKADWRSLAGRLSWRDPAYNKQKNSSNVLIEAPWSMQWKQTQISFMFFTLTYILVTLSQNPMFWPPYGSVKGKEVGKSHGYLSWDLNTCSYQQLNLSQGTN